MGNVQWAMRYPVDLFRVGHITTVSLLSLHGSGENVMRLDRMGEGKVAIDGLSKQNVETLEYPARPAYGENMAQHLPHG